MTEPIGREVARGEAYRGLHVLVDDDPRWPHDPVVQARAACAARVPVVQLRTKHATDAQTLAWAGAIRELTHAAGTRFVVNDRFDIALLAQADGVHLGQDDLPPANVPSDVRERLAIGRSTHTSEQLEAARAEPIDYVAFGPVFGTASKDSDYSPRGLDRVAEAARLAAPRPLVAIGGIELQNLADLRHAGVGGFAVISTLATHDEPTAHARALMTAFDAISDGDKSHEAPGLAGGTK